MWCIQFEAKTNSYFKHVAQAIGNFENAAKAVAIYLIKVQVATTLLMMLIYFMIVAPSLGKVIVYCFTQPCFRIIQIFFTFNGVN